MTAPLGVAVVGCGLIGGRRARTAAAHSGSRAVVVADVDQGRAEALAAEVGAEAVTDWRMAVDRPDVDVVAVCTPNGHLMEIGCAALRAGRHVLLEKPMGRSVAEAECLAATARAAGRVLKVGFNHRHHPAIRRAREIVEAGGIGRVVNLRARYGHGSRPGCQAEWRADPELAGGGELMDQGVHLVDLFHWFAGPAAEAFAVVQTAVWGVAPLEDNAYGIFRFGDGAVGQLHASMTQWKNLFSLEVHGETGAVVVEGLGGSYGTERLVHVRRRMEGGVPETMEEEFPGPDGSWAAEWAEFVVAIRGGAAVAGGPEDGLVAMRMIDALYRSARTGALVAVHA